MNTYLDFQASVFAFCKSMAAEFNSNGLGLPDIFKFDAHADLNEVPAVDVIGPMEFSIETDEGLQMATCIIAISTLDDANLTRLDAMVNRVYNKLYPGSFVPLVQASDGQSLGYLTVMNGTTVLPIMNTTTRPVKGVAVQFASDVAHVP